jgi:hypothetical protein
LGEIRLHNPCRIGCPRALGQPGGFVTRP